MLFLSVTLDVFSRIWYMPGFLLIGKTYVCVLCAVLSVTVWYVYCALC